MVISRTTTRCRNKLKREQKIRKPQPGSRRGGQAEGLGGRIVPGAPLRSPRIYIIPPHTAYPDGGGKGETMGKYTSRKAGYLTGWQMDAALYVFQGLSDKDIAKRIWNIPEEDERALKNAVARLRAARKKPEFMEYYRSLITEWTVHHTGKALEKIASQIGDQNGWLANKAANDVLTQSKLLLTGADDNTVLVKVEGMPVLGTPDDE